MERAFKFLNRTSVSCGAPADGAGVTFEESGGVVTAGDAAAGGEFAGADAGGDSSCAKEVEQITKAEIKAS